LLVINNQRLIRFYLKLLHRLAASYSRIKKSYWGITMAEMDLPDIDLEGRVVIMTSADRGLGRAMSLGLAQKGARLVLASPVRPVRRVRFL
jgi:hypothetical protein